MRIMKKQTSQSAITMAINYSLIVLLLIMPKFIYAGKLKAKILETGIGVRMVSDANRDGYINFSSQEIVVYNKTYKSDIKNKPLLLWINDDDDNSSETSGQDNPNSTSTFSFKHDYENDYIDGSRDLIDFFPIALDLNDLLKQYNEGGLVISAFNEANYEFLLKQEDEAVRAVFTAMTKETVYRYLTDIDVVNNTKAIMGDWQELFGDDVNDVKSESVSAKGLVMPRKFIRYVKETEGAGVILIEGAKKSTKPLQLYLRNKRSDQEYLLGSISLAVYPVTDFYRYVNLRGVETTPPTKTATDALDAVPEPTAFTDADSNGKMMIAMHGYNVSEEDSTGWAAEIFKRIWQTGSNAMFTFITWSGNKTQPPLVSATPNYWTNVVNALNTSSALAQVVNALPGGTEKHIMGHSLGNMVISDAIANKSMQVKNYFMMDAAVALEAYDNGAISYGNDGSAQRMTNPLWRTYIDPACDDVSCTGDKPNNRWLHATEWYQLFDASNDARSDITWRNRFANIFTATNVKNYYSSTEDVLENSDGTLNSIDILTGGDAGIGFKSWGIQEMAKGTDITAANISEVSNIGELDKYGGWGINFVDYNESFQVSGDYQLMSEYISYDPLSVGGYPLLPNSAFNLTTDEIRNAPFFKRFNDELNHQILYGSKSAPLSDATVQPLLPHLLAHAIPALSFAAGRNAIGNIELSGQNVFDGNDVDMFLIRNSWPKERGANDIIRWRHGDLKDVAYLYVYKLYSDFVLKEAKLNQ